MKTKLLAFGVFVLSGACVMAATRYVVPPGGSGTPGGGFTSWDTAATNLQDAAAATTAGDTILVTNGTYYLANQVTVTNFTIRSFNNGAVDRDGTIINGNNYVGKTVTNRCFMLSHANAVVEGLTITNGYAASYTALTANGNGGGVYITAGTLRNCLVTGNTSSNALNGGGGVYATGASSLVTNCDVIANLAAYTSGFPASATGGGGVKLSTSAQLWNSRIMYNNSPVYWSAGGGVHADGAMVTVANCSIVSNKVGQDFNVGGSSSTTLYAWGGGGVWAAGANAVLLRNCLIAGNGRGSGDRGTGLGCNAGQGGIVENCTVVDNVGSGIGANGAGSHTVRNTISYYNSGGDLNNGGGTLVASNCCASSLAAVTSGSGNITTAPAFINRAGRDYRLWPWSAGVDAGWVFPWMSTASDLAGNPRVSLNGLPDMGAYETSYAGVPPQYVARNGQTPVSPYTNGWDSAASNLEDVIPVAFDGGLVLVTNGVYTLTNQIGVANLTIRSFNNGAVDPDGTIINGNYPNATNRCFSLGNPNALVEGFTITNGCARFASRTTANGGGGVYMSAGTLRNCLVTGNFTTNGNGGGVFATGASCLITNCRVVANAVLTPDPGNAAGSGGGGLHLLNGVQVGNTLVQNNRCVYYANAGGGVRCEGTAVLLANCSIIGNSDGAGWTGGGVWMATSGHTLRNCLITGNDDGSQHFAAGVGSGQGLTTYIENCTIVNNVGRGLGVYRYNAGDGCTYRLLNTIAYYNSLGDINAGPAGTVIASNSCVGSAVGITNFVVAGNITIIPAFMQRASGDYRQTPWSAGVDTGLLLPWMSTAADLAGNPRVSANNLPDMGAYETTAGPVVNHYVAQNGQTPVSPYTNGWEAAASNLAEAVSAVSDGTTIWVTNGVYTLAGQITVGNFALRSYNNGVVDRLNTVINGNYPNVTNRCFKLTHANAVVEGFTITNAVVNGDTGGGGVYMSAGTLRDCLVTGNMATNGSGGGVYATGASSLITNCDIIANAAKWNTTPSFGGGGIKLTGAAKVWNSRIMYNLCALYWTAGGGIHADGAALVANCSIVSNRLGASYASALQNTEAVGGGGVFAVGANAVTLRNCLIAGNGAGSYDAGTYGGGVGSSAGSDSTIENCTIVSNWGAGIGARSSVNSGATTYRVANTISYWNSGVAMYPGTNTPGGIGGTLIASNSCATTLFYVTGGSGNITNDPRFASIATGNYRLRSDSPCLNTGLNLPWMTAGAVDLDGNPRISPLINGTVDMGAYESVIQSGTVFMLQ